MSASRKKFTADEGDEWKRYPRFDLQGKVALVTGAARGLGRAIALALAEAGSEVALGLRNIASDSGVTGEVVGRGRRALPLQMDMTSPEQIRQAVATTVQHFGRLDILVNNAGIAPDNLAENVTEEDFDRTVSINLKGTFIACQAAGRVHDPAKERMHYQHELAGRVRRLAD